MTNTSSGRPALAALHAALGGSFMEHVRKQMILSPELPRYSLQANRILTMLYSARSGSTYAAQLLSALPSFSKTTDWFWPERLEQQRLRRGFATHDETIGYILSRVNQPVFALKSTTESLAAAAYLGVLDQFRERHVFVTIERKDKVAQAVSFYKASLSGQFHSTHAARRSVREDQYDFAAIDRHHRRFVDRTKTFAAALDALGASAATIYYEDMIADPRRFVARISEILDLPRARVHPPETSLKPLADMLNQAWAERFRRDAGLEGQPGADHALGSR